MSQYLPALSKNLHGNPSATNSTKCSLSMATKDIQFKVCIPLPYKSLLGLLSLISGCYCTRFPHALPNVPQFQLSLPMLSPLMPPPILPIPIFASAGSAANFILFLLPREFHTAPIDPSILPNLSEYVYCRLLILQLTANVHLLVNTQNPAIGKRERKDCGNQRRWRAPKFGPHNQLNSSQLGSQRLMQQTRSFKCLQQVLCIYFEAASLVFLWES